jgi:hypothetical protein
MQEALEPLRSLTNKGLATLLCHHPSKGHCTPGQAARGLGALPAFADMLLELHPFVIGVPAERRRLLFGFSRHEEAPPGLLIELKALRGIHGCFSNTPQLVAGNVHRFQLKTAHVPSRTKLSPGTRTVG